MDKQTARQMVHSAMLAPSSHNSQPWRFRLHENAIELFADRSRALPVNDPEDRELHISCGCALMNMRLAAAKAGIGLKVELLPQPDNPDLLAKVVQSAPEEEQPLLAQLADEIPSRHTVRSDYEPVSDAGDLISDLRQWARLEGVQLTAVSSEVQRQRIAGLVAQADQTLWSDPAWRRELARWMLPPNRGEGLAVSALWSPFVRTMIRWFNLGSLMARKSTKLVDRAPLLLVLSSCGDGPRQWLETGQALQTVLLGCCQRGYQGSFLNQPVQVPTLRNRLSKITGLASPQILLRVGRPVEKPIASPRRALSGMLDPVSNR
ncbi:Acg family FMN-binding oxidoreductase [Ferrimonas futtsuensis]|uniref:Acg family FMN-binding oxidoreductase n=1 Tax=Ferrimonas futtsuensis TaxID=364764 RepID=UPI0004054314|nr:nitroreductase family protein [Ferrimonas futtsuensis]